MLLELCEGLSDSDKRLLLTSRGYDEDAVKSQLDRIEKNTGSQEFVSDLLANVSGNAVYDAIIWAGKTLFKNLRL